MITLSKIAALAHVSVPTVSKAFSMSSEVNEKTREIIFDIAKKHGCFRKYYNAKYPKHVIAVICPEFKSRYYAGLLSRIQEKFFELNCEVSVASTDFSSSTEEALFEYYSKYAAVDGIIMIDGSAELDSNIDIPVGAINSSRLKNTSVTVKMQYREVLSEALDYFIESGAESIGFIGESKTAKKADLFSDLLAEKTGKCDEKYISISSERFEKGGYEAMQKLIDTKNVPRAVVCAYDQVAIGAISCATENGLRVPEDVAVIGYNDISEAQYLNPPLASMDTNVEGAVEKLAEALIKSLNGIPVSEQVVIEAALKLRKSAHIEKG